MSEVTIHYWREGTNLVTYNVDLDDEALTELIQTADRLQDETAEREEM